MARTLIVLPDDTARAVVKPLHAATRSLRVKMFVLSDARLVNAVVGAHRRGVDTRVLLNAHRRNGVDENAAARAALVEAGVHVMDGNPAFDVTHEKSMVVDDERAVIGSFNWTGKNLSQTRDYGVLTTHRHDVEEISACFEADWERRAFTPRQGSHLLWSPHGARERICSFIDAARDHLNVQNERVQDMLVVDALLRAARRGVKVRVLARSPLTLRRDKLVESVGGLRILRDSGIKVRTLKHPKLHAKALVADGVAAVVGSMNLAPGSFDSRRELGIETHDRELVERLLVTTRRDWKHSHPLDLSDEGLLAGLESREEAGGAL